MALGLIVAAFGDLQRAVTKKKFGPSTLVTETFSVLPLPWCVLLLLQERKHSKSFPKSSCSSFRSYHPHTRPDDSCFFRAHIHIILTSNIEHLIRVFSSPSHIQDTGEQLLWSTSFSIGLVCAWSDLQRERPMAYSVGSRLPRHQPRPHAGHLRARGSPGDHVCSTLEYQAWIANTFAGFTLPERRQSSTNQS